MGRVVACSGLVSFMRDAIFDLADGNDDELSSVVLVLVRCCCDLFWTEAQPIGNNIRG